MLSHFNGKLRIYASGPLTPHSCLEIVGSAARKIAEHLHLDLEIIRFEETGSSAIHVYFRDGNGEEIPLYSVKDRRLNEDEVYTALRNMIFVLSFHPRYSCLKRIQREIMKLS